MDYNCFPFSCCITWGSSTRTKLLASEGHTHSCDSKNQSEEQFKLQKTPKYRALCDVMQPQAGQSWQFCTLRLLCVLSISFTGTWPCLWLFHMQMSPELAFNMQEIYSFQPVSWSSVTKTLIFFFYWSWWKSTEPSFPVISQQLPLLCWLQCCNMWLWIPLCCRSYSLRETAVCDYL